jgi:CBS domain-containing protein
MTVGETCTRAVVTALRSETIPEAARRMRDRHVGTLVVIADDDSRQPVGVLTDRDIVVSAVAQSSEKIPTLLVGDVMSDELVTALAAESMTEALKRMRIHGIRRLPVVGPEGELVGILAADDVLEVMSDELATVASLAAREQVHEREARR